MDSWISITRSAILAIDHYLKPSLPEEIKRFDPPSRLDIANQISFKYADYNKALNVSEPYIKNIISSVKLSGLHKHVLVDVKVLELKKDSYPCLPNWHLDCTMSPDRDGRNEIHHLFIFGADCKTKFVISPVSIPIINGRLVKVGHAIKEQLPKITRINECSITRYDRFGLHAPSLAGESGIRLLIRVTENDFVQPIRIKDPK